jgi:hypothetical protein
MTVVANLLIEGVPTLIGDTVITSDDPNAKSITVPTVKMLPPLRKPITDFLRKVYIIEKRLAVAWTGSRLKAMQLIPSLRNYIKKHGLTENELHAFLSGYQFPVQGGRKLLLIGWIAERDPRPFWWSTEYPTEIVYDEYDIEGTGEAIFRASFLAKDIEHRSPGLTNEEHVYLNCLSGISQLLTLETTQGLPLVHGFGFCYDIVIWSKYRFKYIKNYTQVNIDISYNSVTKSGRLEFRQPIMIYNNVENCAAFCVMTYGGAKNPGQPHDLFGTDPVIIHSFTHQDLISPPKIKFHSKFFCAFLQIVDENGLTFTGPFCFTDEAGPGNGMWLVKQGTQEILRLDMNIVTALHNEVLQNLHSASPPATGGISLK